MAQRELLEAPLPVGGIRLATVAAGVRYQGRPDLVLLEAAPGSRCAAVFTRNAFCAAPVHLAREHLAQAAPRYLLINTGNANAGTGAAGLADARACSTAVAAAAGVREEEVLPFSTGVIGEPLPVAPITAAVPQLLAGLAADGWADAARGIMTTDTQPKLCSARLTVDGTEVTVTGMAKGAGMLRPAMATMLAFIATDAAVAQPVLDAVLREAVDCSFHRISVDGDTSTNDACVLLATGAAGNGEVTDGDSEAARALAEAVGDVCTQLAQGLVRDGEGASKFVAITVAGGEGSDECLAVAFTIAHSPLVKTALFASDPNWGRLLAAIGRAGLADLDVETVSVRLNDVLIAEGGCRAATYTEAAGAAAMAEAEIRIDVDLGRGEASETVWTSDFSYDYVRINAEYRT
ncbi:bifunctional glutamate N-acetyltransferase/amino-acid acetyltransferase ArgJ [Pseudohaliea rubra]|uniref:Arginine biosynthesis bifunctional protein ArgJ n=1 Tax=Pseudohaliea rubra DSM 19751 TaxID=1265313 RepID=A0A095VVD0_9GAMM|nr:bifunctional glutamate N-acetyltransferase/amino-acid acetyltransferase ArgJ [Pseudohaliea rubra]KGE05320.1 Glutamate N-acetyltransferase/ N-acetylglutamate synthase [Pseudohaliea rubra DSM 19751]